MSRRAKPPEGKAEAKRLLARKSAKADAAKVEELESRLAEALEERAALSEILRVISGSPTDLQPVFDAIVASSVRLCGAKFGLVFRFDGELMHLAAHHNYALEARQALQKMLPMRPQPDSPLTAARAILTRAVVQVQDVRAEPGYAQHVAQAGGFRSLLAVPILRAGNPVGAIFLAREQPAPFSATRIALLKTFADQAVIAIENVRLFTELQEKNLALTQAHGQVTEALEQQTATAEILRVISRSPTDLQPIFDAIVESSVRLCGADYGNAVRLEGDVMHLVGQHGQTAEWFEAARRIFPHPLTKDLIGGRSMLDREVVHMEDTQSDTRFPVSQAIARTMGYRTVLSVPMLRDNGPVGAIVVFRQERRPFSGAEIALLKTFADQAVIAIENVRLFKELEARTQDLTRSVGELTALGEVSRALSSTLDLETVLLTIVTRAVQIAGTAGCAIWEYDEPRAEFRLRASHYADKGDVALLQAPGGVTTIPKGQGVTTRVMEQRQPVHIRDIAAEGAYESPIRRPLIEAGHRALLGVPLLSEDEVIGVLAVTRKTPGEFEPEIVRLLTTFATQSALAIQNARLFLEIEDKSRQLEAASQHKSEFLANMSHELRTPLNAIIGFSEVLAEGMFGEINDKQAEYLRDILESGRHLLSLINDILDLSKIEAGRMELEPEDFDLPSAIDNALILVRERAGRRGIALDRTIDGRLGTIRGDERKVKQVLLNLLSNALKFTPEGGRIDVRAAVTDELVEVSVVDTGVGIAPEDQEAVFEEFRQVGTADKKVEGTGLGLALSRKFIELHGGRIWVKSQLGAGSTFTFTIPVRREPGDRGDAALH